MRFFASAAVPTEKQPTQAASADVRAAEGKRSVGSAGGSEKTEAARADPSRHEHHSSTLSGPPAAYAGAHSIGDKQAALPVRPEEVSFNLSISVEEQLAKSKVQLPYMHQGGQAATSAKVSSFSTTTTSSSSSVSTNLFFIDDDDPDWDDDDNDDDLDDDLDI